MNIFLPIMLLSILNICVFILPVESREKASFVVTVFLSLAVFLTIVNGIIPENSGKISILNIFVFVSTLKSTLVAVLTIIHIRLYHKDQCYPVPQYLLKVAKVISGSEDMHISNLEVKSENGNTFSKIERPNKNPMQPRIVPVADSDIRGDVNWPDVVRAMDKPFLFSYFIITVSLIGIAMNEYCHS